MNFASFFFYGIYPDVSLSLRELHKIPFRKRKLFFEYCQNRCFNILFSFWLLDFSSLSLKLPSSTDRYFCLNKFLNNNYW